MGMGVDAVAMAEGVLLGEDEEEEEEEDGAEGEGQEEWEEEAAAAVSGATPLLFYGVQVRFSFLLVEGLCWSGAMAVRCCSARARPWFKSLTPKPQNQLPNP